MNLWQLQISIFLFFLGELMKKGEKKGLKLQAHIVFLLVCVLRYVLSCNIVYYVVDLRTIAISADVCALNSLKF